MYGKHGVSELMAVRAVNRQLNCCMHAPAARLLGDGQRSVIRSGMTRRFALENVEDVKGVLTR